MCSRGCSRSQNRTRSVRSPASGVVLFGGDRDRNHHGAKLIISVSVLHQSSWKFCTYLLLSFASEYHLRYSVLVHVLHSLVGRCQSPSEFCVRYQIFCNVQSCQVSIVAGFHHSGLTFISAETVYEIYVGVFFVCRVLRILTTTELQHNTGTLAYAVYKQELGRVTRVQHSSLH